MKILIVNAHFTNSLGGSEIQCHQIAETVIAMGREVTYLAVGGYKEAQNGFPYPIISCENDSEDILNKCIENYPDIIYWRYNKNSFYPVMKELKKRNIPLVFSVSHIHDLQPFSNKGIQGLSFFHKVKRKLSALYRGWQYSKGFKLVSGVVCNNPDHLNHIKHENKCFIPNSPYTRFIGFYWPKPYVVWVGNIKQHKHPELYIQLANELKDQNVDFIMIGKIQQQNYDYIVDPNITPSNFKYLGSMGIENTNGVIKGSLMVIHTCEPEGFPNVFLQAWAFEKPVISLHFDPGGYLKSHQTGFHSKSFEQMKEDVIFMLNHENDRITLGENAKKLIENNFIKSENVKKLIDFYHKILETA